MIHMPLNVRRFSLFPVGLIWVGVIVAALAAGLLKGLPWEMMWPLAAVAIIPAIIGIILTPVIHREWAQIIVIFGWLALAVIAVLAVSFLPMAILFMCAPAAAALFEREKVVEAMVIAAILAATLFYAAQQGFVPDSLTSGALKDWGQQMGIFATLAFLIGTLMTTSHRQETDMAGLQPQAAAAPAIIGDNGPSSFDSVPGRFFLLDKKNAVVSLNSNAREAFDFADGQGSDIISILGMGAEDSALLNGLLSQARQSGQEAELILPVQMNGEVTALARLSAGRAKDSQIGLTVAKLNSDDSAIAQENILQLQAERDRIQQDSNEKTLFFAGVSHELRTPLNAIIGFSDMMRSRLFGPLPGKYADYADMIHDSGQHMLDLIGDVLDLSKIEAGKYALKYDFFQADDIIRSSVKMVRPSADAAEVALNVNDGAAHDVTLEADRRAVRQILLNLLSNAIKFSPKGSVISVDAAPVGDFLRISVNDQGEGMSAQMVEKIGEPYLDNQGDNISAHSDNARGTGLGLSLVKSLIDLHQGRLNVESELEEGTRIAVDLPLTKPSV